MAERWRPKGLKDLRSFIANGHGEDHYREFKERLPRNERLARHLAAFAIDGGDIFIGVGERDGGFQIAPLPLDGLPERVEEIAQARVDPPLLVETQAIQGDCDPSHGVLWIAVPPSSQAPHQVGGRYYERGDKQSRIMSDAAVERLIRARRRTLAGINSKLEAQIEHDERRAGRRSRVFGAAEPIGAAGDELYRAVGGSAPERWSEFKGVLLSEAGRLEPRRGAEEFLKADSRIRIAIGPNRHVFRREYGDTGPIVAVSDSGAIESPSRVVETPDAARAVTSGDRRLVSGHDHCDACCRATDRPEMVVGHRPRCERGPIGAGTVS